jgi:hypothetical protein
MKLARCWRLSRPACVEGIGLSTRSAKAIHPSSNRLTNLRPSTLRRSEDECCLALETGARAAVRLGSGKVQDALRSAADVQELAAGVGHRVRSSEVSNTRCARRAGRAQQPLRDMTPREARPRNVARGSV